MKLKLLLFLAIALCGGIAGAQAQTDWPREISGDDGVKITMYEPQPESISGNEVTGRAAVSIRKKAADEPVFGAILFTATVRNTSGDVDIQSLNISRAKFSGVENQDDVDRYTALLEEAAARWKWGTSMDELTKAVEQEKNIAQAGNFNNAAPKIIYTDRPTTLVVLDGQPKILHDKDLDADKVVNSPHLIFKEGRQWNLYVGGTWYRSSNVTGGWQVNTRLSSKVKSINESIRKQEKENNGGKEPEADPKVTEIIVATEPTELLQTDGTPEYKNVSGTSLLYVANSPNEIFKDINTQKTYILLAGRWYNSENIKGPWRYVPSDQLPEDFAKIPQGSDKEEVLPNVAGTEAAEEARMDALIPQTAKVDKRTANVEVEYDGEPYFTRIKGTSLRMAENANVTVIEDADGNYFALDNGIWFIGDSPDGPWAVANDRPRDIDAVPASSPAYHAKYVYVYDVEPDYVYMGYTSGYLGSYIYGPTIVYGTGYYYRPWFRRVYYPRPITWGFGFTYDPWWGWNINWGYNWAYMHVGFHYGPIYGYPYGGGWFGPSRYCPPYRRHYWNDGYYYARNASRGNYYNRSYNRNNYYNVNYNIYNNQTGVSTRNVNRTTRVYRPQLADRTSAANTSRPINNRYSNRLNGNSRTIENATTTPDRSGANRLERNDNRREPTLQQPGARVNRTDNSGRLRNNERVERPGISNDNNNNDSRTPSGDFRRDRRERPAVINPEGSRQRTIETPERTRRVSPGRETAPVRRPEINNTPSRRPEINNRQSSPRRPEINRQPAPVQRREYNNRSSAPAQRPTINNHRPSSSQGGSPRVSSQRAERPDRR